MARKLAVLCWHLLTKEADYQWARPALVANKIRAMQLQAGQPARKGNKRGAAYAYNIRSCVIERSTSRATLNVPTNGSSADGSGVVPVGGARVPRRSPSRIHHPGLAAQGGQRLPSYFNFSGAIPGVQAADEEATPHKGLSAHLIL